MPFFRRSKPDPSPEVVSHGDVDPSTGLVITAAVGTLGALGKRRFSLSSSRSDIDETLRDFDRNGPSFLGFYLDLVSDIGGMLDLTIEVWSTEKGKWVDAEDSRQGDILRRLQGPNEESSEIVSSMIRKLELPGELAFLPIDWIDPGISFDPDDPPDPEVRYLVLSTHTLKETKVAGEPYVEVREEPGLKQGQDGYLLLPRERFHRIWRPDPDYRRIHWTPLQRSVPELRTHRTIARTIHRSAASKLLNAGLIWFEGESRPLDVFAQNRTPEVTVHGSRLGTLGDAIRSLVSSGKKHLDDLREEEVAGAMPHPWISKTAPKWIEIGRPFDKAAIESKRDALEDFARGQNIPMSVLVEGQGAGARLLNNIRQDEAFKETAIYPKIARVCNGLTGAFLRPILRAEGMAEEDVGRYRVWFSKANLESKGDPEKIAAAVKGGVLVRLAWARALGREEDLLDLPEGVTEYEHFITTLGRTDVFGELPATLDDVREAISKSTEQRASAWWEE